MAATTLDDIWFPLIKKKGLNKTPVAAEASGLSDLSATYKLIPRSNQLAQAKEASACVQADTPFFIIPYVCSVDW